MFELFERFVFARRGQFGRAQAFFDDGLLHAGIGARQVLHFTRVA